MALREAVVGERRELFEHLGGDLRGDAVRPKALGQLFPYLGHRPVRALEAHRPAELVGLRRGEARQDDRHLHPLLLEEGDAQGPLEHGLQPRIQVGDRLLAVPAPQVGVHHVPLNRAGPDEGDLDDEVVETTRPDARKRVHLGARLDLEDPDRVGRADHVVNGRIVGREPGEIELHSTRPANVPDPLLKNREHAESQKVELDEARQVQVVFVPLDHGAPGHGSGLDRHDLTDRSRREDEAADVDRTVTGQLVQAMYDPDQRTHAGVVRIEAGADHAAVRQTSGRIGRLTATHLGRQTIRVGNRETQHASRIPHGHLPPVGDRLAHHRGVLAAVLPVDVLEDLLAVLVRDVQVDVRRLVALLR